MYIYKSSLYISVIKANVFITHKCYSVRDLNIFLRLQQKHLIGAYEKVSEGNA